jgi:septal ring factor EnvC (AmiA/AmiB activator)
VERVDETEEGEMVITRQARTSLGLVFGAALVFGLTGCDYWPPALQAQIEQLRSETQTLAMEKTQLQAQVNELSKAKQDLQIQVDDLSRVNREKTGLITSLQHQVDQLRAKAVKAMAPKAPAKAAIKPAAKPLAKQPAKKKKT